MAGANAWGAFGALQYIIYEYDNLSDGGVRASESPAKSVFRQRETLLINGVILTTGAWLR